MNLLLGLQGTIGSNKRDAKLAKHFVCKKLSKKVQFLQMGNDELMKKVFTQARKFMKYDSENFMTVWTKIVLPTIKSEMNSHTEEWICSGDQESNHSRYMLHALHCLHCNDLNMPITYCLHSVSYQPK
jgi:hypothetical protein